MEGGYCMLKQALWARSFKAGSDGAWTAEDGSLFQKHIITARG